MTALKKYQKLESPGLWREAPEAQRREVIVNFGEASLILSDPRTETALSHWSLPAVERINPGTTPALYAPGRDAHETLEIDDRDMIGALETVRGVLERAKPKPGRLRGSFLLTGTALVLVAAAVFLPGALVEHTASMVPAATRAAIGRMALADLSRVTGAPCSDPSGQIALERMEQRLFGATGTRLYVLRDGSAKALHLPGGIIALHRSLVESNESGDVAAGFALAEMQRAAEADPMIPLLHYAGIRATFGLLTTGRLDPGALDGYGEELLMNPPAPLASEPLLQRFTNAEVSASPYAYAVDPTGETTLPLIEADPYAKGAARPVLPDGDWISLQAICAE